MTQKWSNLNLPGALHFVTGNCHNRLPLFTEQACCEVFIAELKSLNQTWPSKLVAYVLMPDHFHLLANPRDGCIKEFMRDLKSGVAKGIINAGTKFQFPRNRDGHQVWQESFKALPLWSSCMIWQKINYIHRNPVRTGLVRSAADYYWSSFRSFYSQADEPLAVDHDWWWPDDAEKLSAAMKQLGWYTYEKRRPKEPEGS
jgi:REP element-mobilizing transposase RayT